MGKTTQEGWTTRQSADWHGVAPSTIWRWVDSGLLAPIMRLPGKTGAMLFEPADVKALKVNDAKRRAS